MFGASSLVVIATLWVLIGFSVTTWTIIAMKGRTQWRLARLNRAFGKAFWGAHNVAEAETVANDGAGPLARVCQAGFHAVHENGEHSLQSSGDKKDVLESSLRQQIQKEQHQLESGLMILASIGSTAPFVGLFGTVWGIMHALQDISRAGSASLEVVAGPVGEALVATAIGIATAVPAVLAYNYGLRRARLYVAEMEDFAASFMRIALKAGPGGKRGK
ncbi:MAG: flagellar motor protein MotA [Candidatus Muproteobacteria bacterium RIFCSPHIGHO2_02_FULL_65_16]|uniref:Flagellar motor protein MotA n=1 Tax=Candidatus Muproteobacteria bacterium RIFCSPHIGHO2_02_FULL_65_16 TaxID=1817766 RepID=A0A1F6TXD9_9PROT|nr:MAG: flagellar motor protein MotA [Candidatus Muproteobacteria bacterium RIFCSPHIGHO2_02_FULL_65_16]